MSVLCVGKPAYTCSHWKLHMKEEFKLERHWLLLTPFKLNAPRLRSRGDPVFAFLFLEHKKQKCLKWLGQFVSKTPHFPGAVFRHLFMTNRSHSGRWEGTFLKKKKNTCGKGSSLWEPHSTPPLCCVCGTCCRSAEQLNKSYLLLPEGWLGSAGAAWYLKSE